MKSHFERKILPGESSLQARSCGGDGRFQVGRDGILAILSPADGKVEFICYADKTLCYVKSAMGYPALYPVEPVRIKKPLRAVLMDLDGTSVHSEAFWIWIIQRSTAQLLDKPSFELEEADLPHVSGHSVSEHLQHCIRKYCPDRTVEEARSIYTDIVRAEMQAIAEGRGRVDAFQPAPGLKPFLLTLKERGIKIGLVTSGLYEKAWPEILAAFRIMALGDPRDFYDAIITAGIPLLRGQAGTLGELAPKPHPWLYAEAARVGLGVAPADRHRVLGIEDSAAGVIALRLAGFAVVGMDGGNIEAAGVRDLCTDRCQSLERVLDVII